MGRQSNVEALVRAFDVGVLATFVEGFSNAVLEYMALGKPVVATDGGGTAEVVVDGVTGWFTPPRDAEALAQRIQSLLDDPSKAQAIGERGRERVEREFSIEVLVGKTLRIYTDLLTGNSVAQ